MAPPTPCAAACAWWCRGSGSGRWSPPASPSPPASRPSTAAAADWRGGAGLAGDAALAGTTLLDRRTGAREAVPATRLFVCIGGAPHTEWAKDTPIVRDRGGYLVTGRDLMAGGRLPATWPLEREPFFLETNVPGSFAAGDVRAGPIKRVATAVGEGAMAVAFVHRYLAEAPA